MTFFERLIMKYKNKIISFMLVFMIFTSILSPYCSNDAFANPDSSTGWPTYPEIFAEAAVLIDASTGCVIYDKNCHQKMYPASITKILTTLLAIENGNLNDMVHYYHYDVNMEAGAAGIARKEGEELSLKDTLYAIMLASANECANAAGEYVARKSDAYANQITELKNAAQTYDESKVAISVFADIMNERAKQAGALGTHFANPNGLFDENHYTTPYDMAMIERQAIKNPEFLKLEENTTYDIPATNMNEPITISQRHRMFYKTNANYYEGVFSGKTGYTDQSGSTLVTCAKRNNLTLISVVMKSDGEHVYSDTKSLLDYGFQNFYTSSLSSSDTTFHFGSSDNLDNVSGIFENNLDYLVLDSEGSVILPNNVNISDCTSKLSFDDITDSNPNIVAKLHYYYGNMEVGNTYLLIDNSQESSLSGPVKVTDANTKVSHKKYININIWIILIILAAIIVMIVVLRSKHIFKRKSRLSYKRRRKRY